MPPPNTTPARAEFRSSLQTVRRVLGHAARREIEGDFAEAAFELGCARDCVRAAEEHLARVRAEG